MADLSCPCLIFTCLNLGKELPQAKQSALNYTTREQEFLLGHPTPSVLCFVYKEKTQYIFYKSILLVCFLRLVFLANSVFPIPAHIMSAAFGPLYTCAAQINYSCFCLLIKTRLDLRTKCIYYGWPHSQEIIMWNNLFYFYLVSSVPHKNASTLEILVHCIVNYYSESKLESLNPEINFYSEEISFCLLL